jgi:hypothetical protein
MRRPSSRSLPYGGKDTAIKKFIADEKLATMVGENAPAADAIAIDVHMQ